MDKLSTVTIDAAVLAVPRINCTKDDAFHYVDTLLDWSKLLDEPWVAICMSDRSSEILIDEALFPLRNQLSALFNSHGIVEYSVNDIAIVAERLLTITPSFEAYFRVEDVLSDHFETLPDVVQLTAHRGLQSDLARCITLIAVLRKHCSQPLDSHSFILIEAPSRVVRVRAQVHELEHTRDDLSSLPYPPEFFEGDVLVCHDFRGLIDSLDESAILVSASNDLGIELAIRIAQFKYSIDQGDDTDWGSFLVPTIGKKFRVTCQQICAEGGAAVPSKILRSIVETINGLKKQDVHSLRVDSGGNSPQRTRGLDRAQRRDIDDEFHLHYWDCADGAVELASTVYHNDFSIPE